MSHLGLWTVPAVGSGVGLGARVGVTAGVGLTPGIMDSTCCWIGGRSLCEGSCHCGGRSHTWDYGQYLLLDRG